MIRALSLALASGGALLTALLLPAPARAYDKDGLHVGQAWIRTPPPGAQTAAAYLTVINHGKTPERLLGAASPAAASIEPHVMSMSDGVMRMRSPPDGFAIPAGASLILAPGGNHLMLVGPRRALRTGDHVPMTLSFARAGKLAVEFVVRSDAPATTPGEASPMAGMNMR